MTASVARKCFEENLRLCGDAQKAPVEYNLYKGLAALATALEDVEQRLTRIEQNQQTINQQLVRLDQKVRP